MKDNIVDGLLYVGMSLLFGVCAFLLTMLEAFFVMLFLGFTSKPELHLGYWDSFWVTATGSAIVSLAIIIRSTSESFKD